MVATITAATLTVRLRAPTIRRRSLSRPTGRVRGGGVLRTTIRMIRFGAITRTRVGASAGHFSARALALASAAMDAGAAGSTVVVLVSITVPVGASGIA